MYKFTDLKRLLAPKIRKREDSIDEFFTNLEKSHHLDESGDSTTINPVVQAKIAIELHNNVLTGPKKRGAFAYGALKKLKLDLSEGRTSKANWNEHAFKMVDRSLEQETRKEKEQIALSFRPGGGTAAPAKSFKPAGKKAPGVSTTMRKAPGVSTTMRKKNLAAVEAAARIQNPDAPRPGAHGQRLSCSVRVSSAEL